MIVGGARVRLTMYVSETPEGHVGSDQKQGVTSLQVFERQFSIDQFFM